MRHIEVLQSLQENMSREDKLSESKTYLGMLNRQGRAYMLAASQVSTSLQHRLLEQLQPSSKSILAGMADTYFVPCWYNMLW